MEKSEKLKGQRGERRSKRRGQKTSDETEMIKPDSEGPPNARTRRPQYRGPPGGLPAVRDPLLGEEARPLKLFNLSPRSYPPARNESEGFLLPHAPGLGTEVGNRGLAPRCSPTSAV